jgi:acetate kinase
MEYLGINLHDQENSIRKPGLREINTAESKVKIFIVPTNEELEIANECYGMLK